MKKRTRKVKKNDVLVTKDNKCYTVDYIDFQNENIYCLEKTSSGLPIIIPFSNLFGISP